MTQPEVNVSKLIPNNVFVESCGFVAYKCSVNGNGNGSQIPRITCTTTNFVLSGFS